MYSHLPLLVAAVATVRAQAVNRLPAAAREPLSKQHPKANQNPSKRCAPIALQRQGRCRLPSAHEESPQLSLSHDDMGNESLTRVPMEGVTWKRLCPSYTWEEYLQ